MRQTGGWLRRSTLPLAALLLLAAPGCSPADQPEEPDHGRTKPGLAEDRARQIFAEAVSDNSTNTWFIELAVTDRRSGVTRSGCTTANGLLGAIHRERGLGYDEQSLRAALDIALTMPGRRFAFANPDALANIGFAELETQYPEECALIRSGWTAMRGDAGYQLFTDKPGYRPVGW